MATLPVSQPWALSIQNLLQEKVRFALSVVGVALAVMLILFLLGMREGVAQATVRYLSKTPGSIIVMPEGVRSTGAGSPQLVSRETVDAVASTPGVERAIPVMLMMAIPEFHGRKEVVRLVGYDQERGGGPWKLQEGREPQADNEVVLDSVLADRHNFKVGESFTVAGMDLAVVGLSGQTASWTGSYVFATKTFVDKLRLAPGAASFVLVTPAPGTSRAELVDRLGALEGTNVLMKSQVMGNDQRIVTGILDQILMLMIGAAFVIGALVVAMVIYTATTERRAEYGIMKALGARNGVLYRVVAAQAVAAAGLGAALGVAFAFGMGSLVVSLKPQFAVAIDPPSVGITLAAGFVMALAGALFPARAIARVAPAEVFRR
jgi:putative ABC transport system permease protein